MSEDIAGHLLLQMTLGIDIVGDSVYGCFYELWEEGNESGHVPDQAMTPCKRRIAHATGMFLGAIDKHAFVFLS